MKIVNVVVFLLFASFLVTSTSCQKELDFGTFESTGTLKTDAAFDCLPVSVHGTYIAGNVLTDTNYIEIQVNTTLSGNYLIVSDSTNGYSFKAGGSFAGTGNNTVRLYGAGTPGIPGTNSFIIHYNTPAGDSSFCIVDVDVVADAGANAAYTFAGAGGTCTGGGYAGTYAASVPTNASNTDTVTVDVTALGNFSITTGAINGITFLASGAFTTLGVQQVVLAANGTPIAQGPFDFPVSGNSPGCAFSITFDAPPPPAVFTFGGNPGACTGATLNGDYQESIAVLSSNTATLNVDVSTAGLYTIATTTSNGIIFSATGLFTTTGPQTVTLIASGTPVAAGPFNFLVSGGSTSCSFTIIFDAAPAGIFRCKVNGVDYNFGNNAGATYVTANSNLSMSGDNINGIRFRCAVNLDGNGATVAVGTYINDLPTYSLGNLIQGYYTDVNSMIWGAHIVTPPLDPFTITITSLTATNVQGTFSGPLHDQSGAGPNQVDITNGVFDLPIQ
ncbi:MAG: hypothetical protein ABIT58_02255 [Ferruginibacter sp.]